MSSSLDTNRNDQHIPCRLAIEVRGVVQGVGFRPFIYSLARRLKIAGSVCNRADIVCIEAQGDQRALNAFLRSIKKEAPPQAKVDSVVAHEIPCLDQAGAVFRILDSEGDAPPRPTIPADLATCPQCLAEVLDTRRRRYGYAFTNCTNCGPRWSIITGLPYDRPRTSMVDFDMCHDCRREYDDPTDRRFHAQPIACPACGPKLQLVDSLGKSVIASTDALDAAARMICDGCIVAIKGLGGFQLVVDATSSDAVALLRSRKHRPHKPLAVMVSSVSQAENYCHVSAREQRLLESSATPIVLLRKRNNVDDPSLADFDTVKNKSQIVMDVAPGNPFLGVMLPCTPLHHLLMEAVGRPVVCTSGNISEEPMALANDEAVARLGAIADAFLVHNRVIVRPVDDSVARIDNKNVQILRRGRGYAPLPIEIALPREEATEDSSRDASPTILALGGHLKNTVALKIGHQVVVGSHVGDLDNLESIAVHRHAVDDLLNFFKVKPDLIACDLHPDYESTRHAETLAQQYNVPLIRVQHHQAHVAACMAENSLRGQVLGLAWDGTGYGGDKTIWGGEALLFTPGAPSAKNVENTTDSSDPNDAESENASNIFTRVAHLRQFGLPGGDSAARTPRRVALGTLFEIDADLAAKIGSQLFEPDQLNPLLAMLDRGVQCPRTSSMGRLFDAVSALCGLPAGSDGRQIREISFEGQAAMALEFAAERDYSEAYSLSLVGEEPPYVADWSSLLRGVVDDLTSDVPVGIISARFHNALADLALAIAQRVGCNQVVLTGGCFQNGLLSELVRRRLSSGGFKVYTHRQVPPGDGGIALGQAFIAACQCE